MFNISKSYVKLLGNALGYEFDNANESIEDAFVAAEYVDIRLVYEWISNVTLESGNPDLGLKALHNSHPAMLGILGYVVMSCETLGHALERLVNYHSLISSASFLKIHIHSETLKLEGFEIGYKAPRETLNNLPLQSAFHFPTDFFNLTVLFCVYGPISGPVLLISG